MPSVRQRLQGNRPRARASALGRGALVVLFALSVAGPALGHVAPAYAQSTVTFSTAEAAPADSFAYVVQTLDERSEQWRLADVLLDRAGFGEALDQAMAEGFTDEDGQQLPLDAFLGGEVAVIVDPDAIATLAEESTGPMDFAEMMGSLDMGTPEAESDALEPQGFAIVLDARAPDTVWTALEDQAREDAAQETDYEGTTILYAPAESEDDQGMAIARAGDLILIATTPGDLHGSIDTAAGREPSIATVPEFGTAQQSLPGEFLMFAFSSSLEDTGANFGPFAPAMSKIYGDAYTAMTIAADEPGFRLESIVIPGAGETLPAVAPNYDSELINLAPANTLYLQSSANLGDTRILDVVGALIISMAMGFAGPEAGGAPPDLSSDEAIAQQFETAATMIGINLQTELFHQLEGEYGLWATANMENEEVSAVFASQVADPTVVANTMQQLSFLAQGASGGSSPLTTREIDGGTVYVLDLGDEAGSTIEFGMAGDWLVIGKGDAVERFSGAPEDSLANNEQFQAVMDTLPVEHNSLTYVDMVQMLPILQMLAEEPPDLGMGGMGDFPDASESCASYPDQAAAQAAYDAGESGTFDLDQDFDGEACEDFFVDAAAEGDESNGSEVVADAMSQIDMSAITGFAVVGHSDGDAQRSSAILYISE